MGGINLGGGAYIIGGLYVNIYAQIYVRISNSDYERAKREKFFAECIW